MEPPTIVPKPKSDFVRKLDRIIIVIGCVAGIVFDVVMIILPIQPSLILFPAEWGLATIILLTALIGLLICGLMLLLYSIYDVMFKMKKAWYGAVNFLVLLAVGIFLLFLTNPAGIIILIAASSLSWDI